MLNETARAIYRTLRDAMITNPHYALKCALAIEKGRERGLKFDTETEDEPHECEMCSAADRRKYREHAERTLDLGRRWRGPSRDRHGNLSKRCPHEPEWNLWCFVYRKSEKYVRGGHRDVLASIGCLEVNSLNDPFLLYVEGELMMEALDVLDAEDDAAAATYAATVATYASAP
jgi:hypothetical protein